MKTEKKSEILSLKLSLRNKEMIQKLADDMGVSMTAIVNIAISEYLKRSVS